MITPAASTPVMLYSSDQIAARVEWMANAIVGQLPPDIMIIGLLRGSFVFIADLIRALHRAGGRPQIDFMTLSSYGAGTTSSGNVEINRDINESVMGRDVLIVDDILESGRTLSFARDLIEQRGAKSVKIAVFLEKPGKRKMDITADFTGFTIPDKFVVGYGLDYANYYRELPYIGVVTVN
jgi:hypoxanthine phosphoribosyltransferase